MRSGRSQGHGLAQDFSVDDRPGEEALVLQYGVVEAFEGMFVDDGAGFGVAVDMAGAALMTRPDTVGVGGFAEGL